MLKNRLNDFYRVFLLIHIMNFIMINYLNQVNIIKVIVDEFVINEIFLFKQNFVLQIVMIIKFIFPEFIEKLIIY